MARFPQQDGKFITTQAGCIVGGTQGRGKFRPNRLQQSVAGVMAHTVIDDLEIVAVQISEGQGMPKALTAFYLQVNPLVKGLLVGKAGHYIGPRQGMLAGQGLLEIDKDHIHRDEDGRLYDDVPHIKRGARVDAPGGRVRDHFCQRTRDRNDKPGNPSPRPRYQKDWAKIAG